MVELFLTREQMIELTGYKQAPNQIAWLARNGVRHWVAGTGRPVVPRSGLDGTQGRNDNYDPMLELGPVS